MIGWDINLPLLVRRGEKCKIDRKNKRLYGTNIEERYTPTLFSKGRSLDDVPEELIPSGNLDQPFSTQNFCLCSRGLFHSVLFDIAS